MGVAELRVLTLTLVLLGLLDLRAIAGPTSEPSTSSTVKAASGSGLLDSTNATLGAALSNPNVLSSANSTHFLTRTTVGLERVLWRSARSLGYSLGSTTRTSG